MRGYIQDEMSQTKTEKAKKAEHASKILNSMDGCDQGEGNLKAAETVMGSWEALRHWLDGTGEEGRCPGLQKVLQHPGQHWGWILGNKEGVYVGKGEQEVKENRDDDG